ncbi:MAG: hypothetical protein IPH48_10890 [bacterium]|nr:hypothetical protein [bacterium]
MSAVFMSVDCRGNPLTAANLGAIAASMKLFPWQQVTCESIPDSGLCLGLRTRCVADLSMLRWQQAHVHCVFSGFLTRTLSEFGAAAHVTSGAYARAVAAAYAKYGHEFARHLEGPFTALVYDGEKRQVVAANGRFGNSPLYRYSHDGVGILSSQLAPMAASGLLPVRADHEAVSHLLTYGQVLGQETLIADVEAIEPATTLIMNVDDASWRQERYWSFGSLGEHIDAPFRRHVSEVCDAFEAASDRMMQKRGSYVSGLSGGLDSRLVTAMAAKHDQDIKAWTFGASGSSDIVVSAQVCNVLGIEQLVFATRPDLIAEHAPLYAMAVDGCVRSDFAFALARAESLRNHATITLNGYAGDMILGGSNLGPRFSLLKGNLSNGRLFGADLAQPLLAANRTNRAIALYIGSKYGHRSRLSSMVAHAPRPLADIACDFLEEKSSTLPLSFRGEQWIFDNRLARWTVMGIVCDRNFFADGSLFYDYDVLSRCIATPLKYRQEHRLFSAVLQRLLPEMAKIVNGNSGLSPALPPWRARTAKVVRTIKNGRGGPRLVGSTGNEPDEWARTECRGYLDGLFSAVRTGNRPFWDGEKIDAMWRQHRAGEINAGHEIGLVAVVEHFFQMLEAQRVT